MKPLIPILAGAGALALLLGSRKARGSNMCNDAIGPIEQVPSPNYNRGPRSDVRVIVIHTMEAPKTPNAAHNMAANWAALPSSRVSAHYGVDSDHVVQMVDEADTAWHARTANPFSIGIEHAGSAAQGPAQWADDYNRAMLARSAALAAAICARWGIPPVWLSADELRAGARGITGHRECTDAFEGGQGHGDPGPSFPRQDYAAAVAACLGE